ncbi:MAG: hypothetical protein R3338_06705, partial [Thermoanaerobaculia bacterium]|nr:hypothetical protein [Thermoanaerobaculia bacterium]
MRTVKSVIISSEDGDLLNRLQREVTTVEFVSQESATGDELLAVVDESSAEVPPSVKVKVCLDESAPAEDSDALAMNRESLLGAPRAWFACFDELVREKIQVEALYEKLEISRSVEELLATRDLESVFEKVSLTAATVAGFEIATLFFYDSAEERYVVSFTNDPALRDLDESSPGIPEDLLQEAMETASDFGYEPATESQPGLLVIPLRSEEDPVGLLSVRIPPGEMISARRVARASRYIRGVTLLVSTSFHLTRSNELAMKDDLTRAFNRRFFESYLNQEIERGTRYGTIFSIIFLDL